MKNVLKRSLSVILAITIFFSSVYVGLNELDFSGLFAVKAKAVYSGKCGNNLTWNLDDEGTLTISGTGDMFNYSASFGTDPWASSAPWYSSRQRIKLIIVDDMVTNIGWYAFDGCTSLNTIILGSKITSIGWYAFSGCTSLTEISILDSVTSIGGGAFEYCESLTSITFPDSVATIGVYAFMGCTNLKSITIPDRITSIVQGAFMGCTNLKSIIIPDRVTSIGSQAFNGCSSLTSVTIPNSVTSIGKWAFSNCTGLTTVHYLGSKAQWDIIDIGEDNNALLSANISFNNTGGSDFDEPEQPIEKPITKSSGTFTVAHKDEQQIYSYDYKDLYFDNVATEYNHELATLSLCLALSTFQSEEQYITYGNVGKLLTKCGFGKFESFGSYKIDIDDADNVGCLISQKKIGDTTLLAVAVRSGGYGIEWASNFTLGDVGDHQGFDTAANLVKERIVNYIEQYDISSDVKLWITGYSRGAATATQTAAKITNEGIIPKENVYAYGFATPAGAIEDSDPTDLDKYGNIFNIINFHDLVPRVAPKQWGFGRYGKTYYLPFNENSWASTQEIELDVKEWFKNQGIEYKVDKFIPLYSDIPSVVLPISNDSLGVFLEKLIKDIASSITTRGLYTQELQNSLRAIWTENPDITLPMAFAELVDVLGREIIMKPQYLGAMVVNNIKLFEAHSAFGAYYLGWMATIPANKALDYFNDGSYRRWLINCPVDVYVYDANDNLIAAIENDMPVKIDGASFSYGVDENGQKYFYLPVDAEYNITVKAREDCETTCTVNELSGGSFTESRVVTYEEIPMEKGEELSVSTGAYSEEDIAEGTENGSSAEYVIQDEKEQIIKPNLDIAGEEIEKYTYNVTVEYDENKGVVYGGGTFTIGQFCQVTAENKPGYRFSKWTVSGETVSTDSIYRFAVNEGVTKDGTSDVIIKAEYVSCEHPKFVAGVVAPTCTEEGYTKHTCEVCTYSYTDTKVKANGHKLSDWITDKKATVNAAGSKHKECTVCDEIVETTEIPQLKCSKPRIKFALNDGKYVKVTWNKVSGADTYYVYRKVKGGSYSCLCKTTKTYYVDNSAKAGQTYTYKLRAKNEAGYSSYSSTKTVKHLDQPTLKTATNTSSGVKITWGKVSKAYGYKVYRKTSEGWKYLGKTTKTYFTDKTAKSGKKYTYTVKAYSGDYNSSYSSTGVSKLYLADTTLSTPKSTKKGVKLEWSKVKGAEGYVIYYKTGSGGYKKLTTVKGGSKVTYTHTKAKKGKTYTYKVKAYKSKTYSEYSNAKKIKDKY